MVLTATTRRILDGRDFATGKDSWLGWTVWTYRDEEGERDRMERVRGRENEFAIASENKLDCDNCYVGLLSFSGAR